jgi:DNA (cytosine-5)-methyltransferase 1|tara:strand:- start:304 stop:1296 length:993 start_codon:yes stop_codon:yes gene_type:complete
VNENLTVLDLFSGIGGFSLGLETAGAFRTVAFCEREPFPQAVLRKHWPGVPIYDDVRTIPTDELGRIDLICGGFPCQPWSVAGQQRGAEDDRDLWPAMATLIEKLRPQWVIGENVRGFVNEPMGLTRTVTDLHGIGYQVVTFILPAAGVGAPHRRDRVWIIAHRESDGREQGKQNIGGGREGIGAGEEYRPGNGGETVADAGRNTTGGNPKFHGEEAQWSQGKFQPTNGGQDVANADNEGSQGRKQRRASGESARASTQRSEDGGPQQWLPESRMGGMADGVPRWLDEPDCGRVATGVKNRVARLKALGNAIVPQVVEQIGRAILEAEKV